MSQYDTAATVKDTDYADNLAYLANKSALARHLLQRLDQVAIGTGLYMIAEEKWDHVF